MPATLICRPSEIRTSQEHRIFAHHSAVIRAGQQVASVMPFCTRLICTLATLGGRAHLPLIGCYADPSVSQVSNRGKAFAKRGFAAASSRAVTEMIKEGVLARQGGELVLVNPAAR
jgi:hypothetical protein